MVTYIIVYYRVENIMMKMDDINQKENQVKVSMQAMEARIANLEDLGNVVHIIIQRICIFGSTDIVISVNEVQLLKDVHVFIVCYHPESRIITAVLMNPSHAYPYRIM